MSASVQIIALLFSFIFGFIFYYLGKINGYIIKGSPRIQRSVITILFMLNVVLLYLIGLYKINMGIFHIYFGFMIILGFFVGRLMLKKLLNNVKFSSLLEKIRKKWYTKNSRG